MHRLDCRIGWLAFVMLTIVVLGFMGLSLLVTATGTARFATSMGYDASAGYAAGLLFDAGKGPLLIGVLAFWARRTILFAAIFALIWVCLVTPLLPCNARDGDDGHFSY